MSHIRCWRSVGLVSWVRRRVRTEDNFTQAASLGLERKLAVAIYVSYILGRGGAFAYLTYWLS